MVCPNLVESIGMSQPLVFTYLVESIDTPYLVKSCSVVLIVEAHVLQLEGGDGGVDEQAHLEVLPQLQLFCNTIWIREFDKLETLCEG